ARLAAVRGARALAPVQVGLWDGRQGFVCLDGQDRGGARLAGALQQRRGADPLLPVVPRPRGRDRAGHRRDAPYRLGSGHPQAVQELALRGGSMPGTGYLFDERFLGHDTGETHVALPAGGTLEPVEHSSAARITRRTHTLIAGSGLFDRLTRLSARPATVDDLALYHTRDHIERIRQLCAAGG